MCLWQHIHWPSEPYYTRRTLIMGIKITLKELDVGYLALRHLMAVTSLSATTSWRLSKVIPDLNKLQELKKKTMDKYETEEVKNDQGQVALRRVVEKDLAAYQAEFEELLKEKLTLPIDKLDLEMLENAGLAPSELFTLKFLIKEPSD